MKMKRIKEKVSEVFGDKKTLWERFYSIEQKENRLFFDKNLTVNYRLQGEYVNNLDLNLSKDKFELNNSYYFASIEIENFRFSFSLDKRHYKRIFGEKK